MTMIVDGSNGLSLAGQFNSASNFGFKNRIINGAMMIDQRNAGAAVSNANTYAVDRFINIGATTGTYTVQQSSDAPSGFSNSIVFTVTSTDPNTSGATRIAQRIEGLNVGDLKWGTANASTITISFWTKSSITGTYAVAIRNSATDRSYVSSFSIIAINTWEYKTITIPGDTSGTWLTSNGIGLQIDFTLRSSSGFLTTANTWTAGNYIGVTGQSNLLATNGATFYITGVQLEKGSTATSFDYRPYGTELQLCQRYYAKLGGDANSDIAIGGYQAAGGGYYATLTLPVTMRAAPTVTKVGTWGTINCSQPTISGAGTTTFSFYTAATATGAFLCNASGTSNYITAAIEL